jgi:hypothetical protein
MAKVGMLRVRVLKNYSFDFAPGHFLALFMEEGALLLAFEPGFTNKGRLSTLGIDADHRAGVAVNAFRLT